MRTSSGKAVKVNELVVIKWHDAWGYSSWCTTESMRDDNKPVEITSVGWLMASNKDGVTVSSCLRNDMQGGPLHQFIPRGCIVSVTGIKGFTMEEKP